MKHLVTSYKILIVLQMGLCIFEFVFRDIFAKYVHVIFPIQEIMLVIFAIMTVVIRANHRHKRFNDIIKQIQDEEDE